MFNHLVILALLGLPVVATASTQYTFTLESTGPYGARRTGAITLDRERCRIDLEPEDRPRPFDTLLCDGQSLPIAVNHANATWYRLEDTSTRGLPHSLFDLHRTYATTAANVRLNRAVEPDGQQIITFRYRTVTDFGGGTSRGDVSGRLVLQTIDAAVSIQPLLLAMDMRTWMPEVDRQLRAALAEVPGTIVRAELTVTRSLEGTQPLKETVRAVLHPRAQPTTGAEDFKVPSGYSYQKPQFEVPAQAK